MTKKLPRNVPTFVSCLRPQTRRNWSIKTWSDLEIVMPWETKSLWENNHYSVALLQSLVRLDTIPDRPIIGLSMSFRMCSTSISREASLLLLWFIWIFWAQRNNEGHRQHYINITVHEHTARHVTVLYRECMFLSAYECWYITTCIGVKLNKMKTQPHLLNTELSILVVI